MAATSAVAATGTYAIARSPDAAPQTAPSPAPVQLTGSLPPAKLALCALDLRVTDVEPLAALKQLLEAVESASAPRVLVGISLGSGILSRFTQRLCQLKEMPTFSGDVLNANTVHGDALIHATGGSADSLQGAIAKILEDAPAWRVRWRIAGYRPGNTTQNGVGLTRNPFHFAEGFGNPSSDRETLDRALIRRDQSEPEWAVGGSYQVVRIIRLATELWDRDSIDEQERIIGRRRDGRWLDGTPLDERAEFSGDPLGKTTPLDSHVRRAAPDRRNPPPLVRRSYSYSRGEGDSGIIFSCFQRDLKAGFEAVQKRLEGESMSQYMLTTGGGYYFVPPPGNRWLDLLN
ncbi:Dyp-type peroxidase [Streptomyces sp.]|uniref:Dyp-type peroxidase n=1 Tax=Streptomyces sp. TaxID=1931 RepID=UPI002F940A8D